MQHLPAIIYRAYNGNNYIHTYVSLNDNVVLFLVAFLDRWTDGCLSVVATKKNERKVN